jgi:amino acid adenylation domain-containing protein
MSTKLAPRLSKDKQKLMSLLLAEAGLPSRKRILRRGNVEYVPLSFAQQRLWFLDQLEAGNPQYNTPVGAAISGPLNLSLLEQTIGEIVKRHEALRTILPVVNGQPVQQILPSVELKLPVIDLTHLPASERRQHAIRIRDREASVPFDLATGPLVRVVLLRLAEEEHWLLLLTHHVVFDSWSVGIFSQELALVYSALSEGVRPSLPELEIQYADFAVWQRQWLQGTVLEEQLDFWVQNLKTAPPMLPLPTDRPRPAVQTFRGRIEGIRLSLELTRALREMSRREGVTLYMIFLAAFKTLLFRYCNQADIIVSGGVAHRNRSELENLIGCFINILLFRTDLSGDPTFLELLQRVQKVTLDVYAHQDVPFEKIVAALHPTRDLSFNPLTQVMLVLHNSARPVSEFSGLTLKPIGTPEKQVAQYDLLLHIYDRLNEPSMGLHGILEYNTDLFDNTTIERLLHHFQLLLKSVVSNPHQRISTLSILSEQDRHLLLRENNDTGSPYPHELCLHTLFEEQVVRSPEAVALICGEQQLSYLELNERANRIAHRLRTLGVGAEVAVGIYMLRSVEMVVGLLGILKAGGAYLPLDPHYPRERLSFMLNDAGANVVLTQESLLAGLPEHQGKVLSVDGDRQSIEEEPIENPPHETDPENLVYLIYTSGSTGQPKGVMLNHRGRVNNFIDFNRRFAVGSQDRLLGLSSLSFDMCAYDVFGTLAAGAALVLPEASMERDPQHWAELILRHRVTVWHSVPTLMEMLVKYVTDRPELHPSLLRLVLLGGDWIAVTLPERLKAIVEGVQIISLGGATEVSMDSTIYPIQSRDHARTSIPYGQPMANQLAFVLDSNQQPVPIGVSGELHLGGVGLARGYHQRPDLTAEKFVPHPFAFKPGERLYKTGDLVRYLADGNLELLGRIDHQVKIRGFRIELGEVVAALEQHPMVEEAVALMREDKPGDKRLVAYVVPQHGVTPGVAELQEFLRSTLPDYMVPSAWVMLKALPLSPNGKVDRRGLPAPDTTHHASNQAYAPPGNKLEETIKRIWTEVLCVEEISVNDNFFELGGDSFKVISAIQQLQQPVALVDFLKGPTIRSLAKHMTQDQGDNSWILHQITRPAKDDAPALVCIPYGGGNVVVYQPLAQALAEDFALYSVALPGHDMGRKDEDLVSIDEIARSCVEEIKTHIQRPLYLYGHCAGAALTVEIARLLENDQRDLRGVFVGGALPWSESKWQQALRRFARIRRFDTDEQIFAYIKSLGGIGENVDAQQVDFVARGFRHDGQCANDYYRRASRSRTLKRLNAPMLCIIGDADPLTKDYETRFKQWRLFSHSVELAVIRGGGHYFLKHQVAQLASTIRDNERVRESERLCRISRKEKAE